MTKEYDLPVKYSETAPKVRKLIREQYTREQNGLCYWCEMPLRDPPPKCITDKKIEWSYFPPFFLKAPVHLQHDHGTDLTEGAVHAYCNAVMWQYHSR
jgi:hypothetical protein